MTMIDCGLYTTLHDVLNWVEMENPYGSVSAGREKWPFNVLFFFWKK